MKPMKESTRNKTAEYMEELLMWADRSVPLSADRATITESYSTLSTLHNTTTKSLVFTKKELQDAHAQKLRFQRDTASLESRLVFDWVIEEACAEHALQCPNEIPLINRRFGAFPYLQHIGMRYHCHA